MAFRDDDIRLEQALRNVLGKSALAKPWLKLFASLIHHADLLDVEAWQITLNKTRLQLNVGQAAVLTAFHSTSEGSEIRAYLDKDSVNTTDVESFEPVGIEIEREFPFENLPPTLEVFVPTRSGENAANLPFAACSKHVENAIAARRGKSTWAAHHSGGFVLYLNRVLDEALRQPAYYQ